MIVDEHILNLKTSVDDVWSFISQVNNMLGLIPQNNMKSSQAQTKPDGGYVYQVTYQFFRLNIKTSSETVEMIPNEKLVIETSGQFSGRTIWLLAPIDEGTQLTIRYEYDQPKNLLVPLTQFYTQTVISDTLATIVENVRKKLK